MLVADTLDASNPLRTLRSWREAGLEIC